LEVWNKVDLVKDEEEF